VLRVHKTTGAVSVLSTDAGTPMSIAVRGGFVYWASGGAASVLRAPTAGGPPQVVWKAPAFVWDIALDDTAVFAASLGSGGGGGIVRIPIGGGAPQQIATAQYAYAVAVDETRVYWIDRFAKLVAKALKSGGATEVIVQTKEMGWDLAVDDSCVYWTSDWENSVTRAPK
jgi:hypothetical protein